LTIEIVPTLSCPVGCVYCYWEPTWAENPELRKINYDIDKMVEGWEKVAKMRGHKEAIFHGGEPLLMSVEDMDKLCAKLKEKGCEIFGIQTSTYGMTDERIALFKKYGFNIGISFDGGWYNGCPNCFVSLEPTKAGENVICPNCKKEVVVYEFDLNRGRGWFANPAKQKEFANKTIYWIEKLHANGLTPGTITIINKFNAENDIKLGALTKFYIDRPWLHPRFNPVHEELSALKFLELPEERMAEVYKKLADYCFDYGLNWYPIRSMQNALLGLSINDCWFGTDCDATNTLASTFVTDIGETNVCPKLSTVFETALQISYTHSPIAWRQKILEQTPFEKGGCKGCKYWNLCRGGCESDGIDGDIRNRTRFCQHIYSLYEHIEKRMKTMFPSLITFAELPIEEQNKRLRKVRGWTNTNINQFVGLIRQTEKVQDLNVARPAKIITDITWEYVPEEERWARHENKEKEKGIFE
jgi:uncharacterized protein